MVHFVMMVGLPGSGKSYYAEQVYKKRYNAVIHSSDDIREELFGNAELQENSDKVFKVLHERALKDLSDGINVIYDATNINYKRRMAFLDNIKKLDVYKLCVLVATPYEDCLEQNKLRDRKVPEHVIERMYKNIYIPQYYEGWDEITIKFNASKKYYMVDLFNELDEINQDNPHHTLTIGKHCRKTCENLPLENEILSIAGLLHDIGKKFTKRFTNMKGEKTDHAHYYQHHLVSAYESLFYYSTYYEIDSLLKLVNYIQWHMQPFFIENEKTKNKYIKLWGQEFYDNLMLLHEADKSAK